MRRVLAVLLVLAIVPAVGSCGDDDKKTPASPSPVPDPNFPRAVLYPVGVFTFTGCTFTAPAACQFQANLENRGAGCAIRVEGITRLIDSVTNFQVGGAYRWALPAQQIVRPGEKVLYVINFVPISDAFRAGSYFTDVNWIDTSCK